MAGTLPPGIGNDSQATQATAFIRQQPWYQQWLQAQGLPVTQDDVRLSDDQRDQLRDLIVANGVGLNNKYDGINENGQIVEEHHKLRNTLVGAGIGAAALTGLGAVGIGPLAGLLGGAGAASAGAGASVTAAGGSVLPSTVIGSGFLPALSGAVPTGLGAAGTTAAVGGAVGGAGSTLAKIANFLPKIGDTIGAANQAAGNNRLDQENAGLVANAQNISGQAQQENALTNRATLDARLRNTDLKNVFMNSMADNPRVSPFNPVGAPKLSDQYRSTLKTIAGQGATNLATPRMALPPVVPYKPLDITNVQKSTGTEPSTLSKIGQWAGPATSIAAKILPFLKF